MTTISLSSRLASMPDEAQVWIYLANRPLQENDLTKATEVLSSFVEGWKAHGKPLKATFEIFYNQVLVLAADPALEAPSGCSIDASVHCIKTLGELLQIDFFDRLLVAYLEQDHLKTLPFDIVKRNIKLGEFSADTLILNNNMSTMADFRQKWLCQASASWLGRFFSVR